MVIVGLCGLLDIVRLARCLLKFKDAECTQAARACQVFEHPHMTQGPLYFAEKV